MLMSILTCADKHILKVGTQFFVEFLFQNLLEILKKDLNFENFWKGEYKFFLDLNQATKSIEKMNKDNLPRFVAIFTPLTQKEDEERFFEIQKMLKNTPLYFLTFFGRKDFFLECQKVSCISKFICLFPLNDLDEFNDFFSDKLEIDFFETIKSFAQSLSENTFEKIFLNTLIN